MEQRDEDYRSNNSEMSKSSCTGALFSVSCAAVCFGTSPLVIPQEPETFRRASQKLTSFCPCGFSFPEEILSTGPAEPDGEKKII